MSATTAIATLPKAGTYAIDPTHTEVGFIARHLVGTRVRGRFGEASGTFTVAENPEESTLKASVEAASITTGNATRDDHLRTNDFLDVPNHPTISLTSIGLRREDDAHWVLKGELTIRGVTKPVDFHVEYLGEGPSMQEGKTVVAFSATGEIDRRDFGVNFNHSLLDGSVVVGNRVVIELEVEASLVD
jgi:polyisoprenoid-binding protein YceI